MRLATRLTVSRADVWWYCGGRTLYNWLPHNWGGPNEYRNEKGEPVNAKGGPPDCPLGNPLCEYGVRGGAGWECWNHHPLAAKLVKDPRFWASYVDDNPDGEDWCQ
ncbi:hypothetical protein AAFF_G00018410 [Aldrovandia affinis]|uniref:Uncharacterized protein n=1 Tax=Aldrovandia affinis TaxID=143900 RepID=A0AAD7VYI2_9TELE|nr:hypothetical protein AAFF_G00018410 [Aldrovandia affinis]